MTFIEGLCPPPLLLEPREPHPYNFARHVRRTPWSLARSGHFWRVACWQGRRSCAPSLPARRIAQPVFSLWTVEGLSSRLPLPLRPAAAIRVYAQKICTGYAGMCYSSLQTAERTDRLKFWSQPQIAERKVSGILEVSKQNEGLVETGAPWFSAWREPAFTF